MERGRRGQQRRAMEDCSTDERLQQKTLCRQQWWTDEFVERPDTEVDDVERSRRLAW